jgi:hypothetical protein
VGLSSLILASVVGFCLCPSERELEIEYSVPGELPRIHIGVMTHTGRHSDVPGLLNFWIYEFLNLSYSDGLHFVSDSTIDNISIPTVVVPLSEPAKLGRDQAAKRLASLVFFLSRSSAPFFIYMNSDTYLWVRNLKFLVSRVQAQRLSGDSKVIWGNCIDPDITFLQGGSYFMSRKVAELLKMVGDQWHNFTSPEDLAFMDALKAIGIVAPECTSEFILGQYLNCDSDRDAIERFNFSKFKTCPRHANHLSPKCGSFLSPFRNLVLVHRLSMCNFTEDPIPPYDYPPTLYWMMGRIYPHFCLIYPQSSRQAWHAVKFPWIA